MHSKITHCIHDCVCTEMICFYSDHIWQGILLHGPLLGWAKMSGDIIFDYKEPATGLSYMMPKRSGLEFIVYPWKTHLRDACDGAKAMLKLLNEWTYSETVNQAFDLIDLIHFQSDFSTCPDGSCFFLIV